MLQIDQTIVSPDIIEKKFCCDLDSCKGICCVLGDSGAPLLPDEAEILEFIYDDVKEFLTPAGITTIEKQGFFIFDGDGDLVTPLIDGKECAYTFFEDGIARCAIEKTYSLMKIDFRKPVSCHLYPIRIKELKNFDAVNYEKWEKCDPGIYLGEKNQVDLYNFLKDALIRKYGLSWYEQLDYAAQHLKK
ncbi:MAG: DUF3109 family protein [Bacteroidia bacterium]|nr:DUF3109 family protein [Bacteroidia bacterium]